MSVCLYTSTWCWLKPKWMIPSRGRSRKTRSRLKQTTVSVYVWNQSCEKLWALLSPGPYTCWHVGLTRPRKKNLAFRWFSVDRTKMRPNSPKWIQIDGTLSYSVWIINDLWGWYWFWWDFLQCLRYQKLVESWINIALVGNSDLWFPTNPEWENRIVSFPDSHTQPLELLVELLPEIPKTTSTRYENSESRKLFSTKDRGRVFGCFWLPKLEFLTT